MVTAMEGAVGACVGADVGFDDEDVGWWCR